MCCGPVCGNGYVDPGEGCDEGPENGAGSCTCSADCRNAGVCTVDAVTCCTEDADCSSETCCGDGTVSAPEECDDGNRIDDDGCSNNCTENDGIPSCVGFGAAQAIQATLKLTKLFDKSGGSPDRNIEKWKSKGSFTLSESQAARFDPERQVVQIKLAQKAGMGEREELWANHPFVPPNECQPEEPFCFQRRGRADHFRWKYKDTDEGMNPGLRKGSFKQKDTEFKFVLDGKREALINVPTDMIGANLFKVRQEIIVDGLCMTVQVQCERKSSAKTYKCKPTLVP
jgi:cysteine-rich repeat protein